MNNEVVIAFANALTKNSKLTAIGFDEIVHNRDKITSSYQRRLGGHISCPLWRIIDRRYLDATFNSIHTLEKVCEKRYFLSMPIEERLTNDLFDLLCIWMQAMTASLMLQGRRFYRPTLDGGNMKESEDMDRKVMPQAMTCWDNMCSIIFCVVCPHYFLFLLGKDMM